MLLSMVFAEGNENTNVFNKYMSPEGGVNPMSGTVALQKNLTSLSVGQLSVNFTLKYSGNIYQEVRTPNNKTYSGIVGLGWSIGRSKIICESKGTAFLDDDTYYLITADGNRYQFFQLSKNAVSEFEKKWWVEGNPYWKVERIIDNLRLPNNDKGIKWEFVKGWKITDPGGIVHIYGDISESLTNPKPNATEYDFAWLQYKDNNGNLQPAYGIMDDTYGGTPSYYPVAWNISKEEALDGSTLVYEYEQKSEQLSGYFSQTKDKPQKKEKWTSDIGYTKESYLKTVRASNNARIEFSYEEKGKGDFLGEYVDGKGEEEDFSDDGSDMYKEKIQRKYLSKIETYGPSTNVRGEYLGEISFCYSPLLKGTANVKRLLSAVRFFDKNHTEVDFEEYSYHPDRANEYNSNTDGNVRPTGALFKVKGKNCGWIEYKYTHESVGNNVVELPVDSIYGIGTLENGTSYLVGRDNNDLKIYTRILGRWVLTKVKDSANEEDNWVSIPAASRVQFGDAGWFIAIKDKKTDDKINSEATIIRWDGRNWRIASSVKYSSEKPYLLNITSFNQKDIVAGPDYALVYSRENGHLTIHFIWTKWGGKIKSIEMENVGDAPNLSISAQKNHILVQALDNCRFACGDQLLYKVFSFRNDTWHETKSDEDVDDDNHIVLNGSFLGDFGEAKDWDEASRAKIYNWNGQAWILQVKKDFNNTKPADAPAYSHDYFTSRYLDKRILRIFALENGSWNAEAYNEKVHDYHLTGNYLWNGHGSNDFFVMTYSNN